MSNNKKKNTENSIALVALKAMGMKEVLELHPKLKVEFEAAIKEAQKELSEEKDDLQSIIDELHKVVAIKEESLKAFEEKVVELEDELEKSKKDLGVSEENGIIMDKKKLDPKKKYLSGPNGKGFVEVK